LKVKDLMRTGKGHPIVNKDTPVKQVLMKITTARAGCCSVIDSKGKLVGIFTDGDLRRHLKGDGGAILKGQVSRYATKSPVTIDEEQLASDALNMIRSKKIDELPVVDNKGRAVGLLDIQDLLKAGFV